MPSASARLVLAAELAVNVIAVPVVPFVHRDGHEVVGRRGRVRLAARDGSSALLRISSLSRATCARHLFGGCSPQGSCALVKMLGDEVHLVAAFFEHALRPADVAFFAAVGKRCLACQGRRSRRGSSFGSTLRIASANRIVFQHVLVEFHVAELPRPPHFVADAPVLDAVRLGVAVLRRASEPPIVSLEPFAVFDFLRGRIVVAKAGVNGDHRLGADLVAEVDELVDAEVVVLDAGPGRILARRPAIAGADAVAPVVAADEVSAGPAVDRRSSVA